MNGVFETRYKTLNLKQKEAVDTVYGPVMVIAGPGTGKTTVLTLRIANILRQTDARPEEILAITFTDSGVKAMREKLREIIGDASFRVNIFTFHGFANYMRALYPENFKHIGDRIPCSDIDQVEIIEEIFEEKSFKELQISTFRVTIKSIKSRISELKRENIDTEKLAKLISVSEREFEEEVAISEHKTKTFENEVEKKRKYFVRMKEFNEVFSMYESKLKTRGIYDFDDTIVGLIDALTENPSMQTEMRENFQFILADEHQDANGAQNEILKFFSDPNAIDPPNLFVVGDDKQSIFRFQGASLENFYMFKDLFPEAKKIDLEENYRSHPTILDASHSLISADGGIHTKLKTNVSYNAKPIEINEFNEEDLELQAVAQDVATLLKKNPSDTIAVLSRNNATLFRLATYLDALDVDYSLKGEQSLFESLEYQKILSLLKAISDPWESGELIETMFFGFFAFNLRDIFALQDVAYKKRRTVGDVFLSKDSDFVPEDKEALEHIKQTFIELISESKKQPLLQFLKLLKDKIILSDKSEVYPVLKLVFDEAEKLTLKKRSALLHDFVSHLTLIEKHNITPLSHTFERDAHVTLSSIHKSKGLEFDTVFIIGVTEKSFEKESRKSDPLQVPGIGVAKELAEERRLLYVALTRAKKHIIVSYSLLGQKQDIVAPSVLLDELDPRLVVRKPYDRVIEKVDLLSINPHFSLSAKEKLRERFLQRGFSVSALNNYLECPYKYLFRNLLLIPDVKEFSALLGTACHEVLRRFHLKQKRNEEVSQKELKQMIDEEIYRQPFAQKDIDIALEKATENLIAYTNTFTGFKNVDVFVEESLSFPMALPSVSGDFEIIINGKIDLALLKNGEVEVIDFKSKKRMTQNAIMGLTASDSGNEYRQLQFYKLLWQNVRRDEEVKKGSLVFLTPEKGQTRTESFVLESEQLTSIEEILKQTLKEIYEGTFIGKTCEQKECEFCRKGFVL